jgi:hypothetical protein
MGLRAVWRLEQPANPLTVNAVSLLTLLLIGWLDYITGYEFGFFIFYFIPVAIAAWLCGKRSGLAMAFTSALCWYLSDKYTHHPYSEAFFIYWEMFMRLLSFLTTALTVSRIREMLLNEERLNAELRKALQEVRELKARIADPETFNH